MATPRWLGRALATYDVWTITCGGTWLAADLAYITIDGKTLTLTVGTAVATTDIALQLTAMYNATTFGAGYSSNRVGTDIPEFSEAAAVAVGSTVVITARTAGIPMVIGVSKTSAAGTVSISNTTVATGPNFWNNVNNWDTGAVPINGDTVYIENSNVPILYGLAQSAVTLTALHIAASYVNPGQIGLPKTNASGGYPEYRPDWLAISATNIYIGRGIGLGSGLIKIDAGSVACTAEIFTTGQSTDPNQAIEAVLLKGTSLTTVEVHDGSVGIAPAGSDVATVTTLRVARGSVQTYIGATVTTVNFTDGQLVMQLAPTTLNQNGGTSTINGATGMTTANVRSGTLYYNSSGTIATCNLSEMGGGTLDCSQDISPRTITNFNVYAGFVFNDPQQTVTLPNGMVRATNVRRLTGA